jgi:phosphopantothenoylcysteine decarboxylase/phosphopantothenate--cysteine ligase
MVALKDKKILLAITGSIAAYKSAVLCRALIKAGAEVRVIMTPNACQFVGALTMSTLSGHDVLTSVTSDEGWNNHVELGLWADVMLVAPCTATTLSKMASGCADNIVVACYLSAKCPVFIAPAMDLDMWKHPSTIRNLNFLRSADNKIIPVGHGFLASGLVGDGRMAEPEEITAFLSDHLIQIQDLLGKNVLITAGPTFEAIDPVRFIGNRSTGKQGISLAIECANRGANVNLILGPSSLNADHPNVHVTKVESAQQMFDAANSHFSSADLIILSAAVADYKSTVIADQKMKKKDNEMSIQLERTIDIAATFGSKKRENQYIIGFALETNDEIEHAKAKLHKKNLDFIVLNSLKDVGAGFAHDTNKITILDKSGEFEIFKLKSKEAVAKDIISHYIKKILP